MPTSTLEPAHPRAGLLGTLRRRLRRPWHPPRERRAVLHSRRVYILPTRSGFVFAGAMLLLITASLAYLLNLGFILAFLLTGSAVAALWHTNSNIRGLECFTGETQLAEAGSAALLWIEISNPGRRAHYALEVELLDEERLVPSMSTGDTAPATGEACLGVGQRLMFDLPPGATQRICCAVLRAERGVTPAPRIRIATEFPFGLWRSWAIFSPAAEMLHAPRPEAAAPAWPGADEPRTPINRQAPVNPEDEMPTGVRPWRDGDRARLFAWRVWLRSGQPASRHHEPDITAGSLRPLTLSYADLPEQMPVEQKLSRLAAWIDQAEQAQRPYCMALPEAHVAAGLGARHFNACRQLLARHVPPGRQEGR